MTLDAIPSEGIASYHDYKWDSPADLQSLWAHMVAEAVETSEAMSAVQQSPLAKRVTMCTRFARNRRTSSYVDRTPVSCRGSWDAPLIVVQEVDGEWVLMSICRQCKQPHGLNAARAVKRHRRVA